MFPPPATLLQDLHSRLWEPIESQLPPLSVRVSPGSIFQGETAVLRCTCPPPTTVLGQLTHAVLGNHVYVSFLGNEVKTWRLQASATPMPLALGVHGPTILR